MPSPPLKVTPVTEVEQPASTAPPERLDRRLNAAFWRLFGATAASNLADGISRALVPLLAATLTPVIRSSGTGPNY